MSISIYALNRQNSSRRETRDRCETSKLFRVENMHEKTITKGNENGKINK